MGTTNFDNVAANSFVGNLAGNVTGGRTGATEVLVADKTLTAAESGGTFFFNHATGFDVTLPEPAAGLNYKFIVSVPPTTGNDTVVTNAAATIIDGLADVNSTLVPADDEHTIVLTANAAISGDWAEVTSDGTSWFVTGQAAAATGIAFSAA